MRGLNTMKSFSTKHLSKVLPLEDSPVSITMEMEKTISKMKSEKAAGPSGVDDQGLPTA